MQMMCPFNVYYILVKSFIIFGGICQICWCYCRKGRKDRIDVLHNRKIRCFYESKGRLPETANNRQFQQVTSNYVWHCKPNIIVLKTFWNWQLLAVSGSRPFLRLLYLLGYNFWAINYVKRMGRLQPQHSILNFAKLLHKCLIIAI